MEQVFTTLSHAVEGAPTLALTASLLWGVLSIVLSPCHLASIPLIVGFISGQGEMSVRRAFWIATLFAAGILITIGIVGALTASLGRMLGDVGRAGNYAVACIFLIVGMHLVGVVPLRFPGMNSGAAGMKRKGALAALLLGLLFGIALGPCTFAFMAPMLAVTFRMAGDAPIYSAALLLVYGVGHCAVIVAAGTSTKLVQRFLDWNEQSKSVAGLRIACGVLVILGGIWLLYAVP